MSNQEQERLDAACLDHQWQETPQENSTESEEAEACGATQGAVPRICPDPGRVTE